MISMPSRRAVPADSPGSEGRGLPVVLLEPQIVLGGIDPESLEALDVHVLYLDRRWLDDHLELVVLD